MKKPYARALAAFDTITEASYRGFAMREFLATNDVALLFAEKLAASLVAAGLASTCPLQTSEPCHDPECLGSHFRGARPEACRECKA